MRLLIIGDFEGIDGERGIAWRIADTLALRRFAGFAITESTPDHSTFSRNQRLIDLETHQEVFTWMLQTLAKHRLLRFGKPAAYRVCGTRSGAFFQCSLARSEPNLPQFSGRRFERASTRGCRIFAQISN